MRQRRSTILRLNYASVARILFGTGWPPLAIELAAARLRAMAPEQIAERLASRFELLNRGRRGASARQQTLRVCHRLELRALYRDQAAEAGMPIGLRGKLRAAPHSRRSPNRHRTLSDPTTDHVVLVDDDETRLTARMPTHLRATRSLRRRVICMADHHPRDHAHAGQQRRRSVWHDYQAEVFPTAVNRLPCSETYEFENAAAG